jgi:hypothetical protein
MWIMPTSGLRRCFGEPLGLAGISRRPGRHNPKLAGRVFLLTRARKLAWSYASSCQAWVTRPSPRALPRMVVRGARRIALCRTPSAG